MTAVAVWAAWRRVQRVVVTGESMSPTFLAGDRLLVVRGRRPRPGDVVAVADPRQEGRLLVKRVREVTGDGLDVRGDNEAASTDSRHFGLVTAASVAGNVVYRYAPPERVGWCPE